LVIFLRFDSLAYYSVRFRENIFDDPPEILSGYANFRLTIFVVNPLIWKNFVMVTAALTITLVKHESKGKKLVFIKGNDYNNKSYIFELLRDVKNFFGYPFQK